jgi:hypothetical protein
MTKAIEIVGGVVAMGVRLLLTAGALALVAAAGAALLGL